MPERTAVPPELRKSSVTFSHQRWSVGSRSGSLTVSFAGDGVVVAGDAGGDGAAGELLGGAVGSGVPLGGRVEGSVAVGSADGS
ncbi:hypothetical protein GCM10018780_38680 [Streptomyces lanatus]|nr:hypothetical protein GCM10018780_38680 [Streptomyces lanatus]